MPSPTFTRRRLLAGAAATGIAAGALAAVEAWSPSGHTASPVRTPPSATPTLVLVTLYGGNDGLNTVVPAADPAYQSGRPTLGYQENQVLPLADGLGLNPQLKNLGKLWGAKQLAVVRGVGYPDPNLSHFASMDIWQTANPQEGTGPGWLGKWLDGTSGDPLRAVSIGASVPPALRGVHSSAAALTATTITLPVPARSQMAYSALVRPGPDRTGLAASIAASGADLLSARTELDKLHPTSPDSAPDTAGGSGAAAQTTMGKGGAGAATLSDQLQIVASLITAGAPGRVYHVSLSSFDTHADEKTAHEAKLAELDAGIGSFFTSLQGSAQAANTVMMTYSEFGRRVAQNASGGTDHGTAAPLFVVGPGVKGGRFYGDEPSLTKLDPNGNLVYNVDFRSVYATMLEQVVGVDSTQVLGARYPTLALT